MGHRHFNENNLPNFPLIKKEILNYFNELPINYKKLSKHIIETQEFNVFNPTEGGVAKLALMNLHSIEINPIKIKGIYVIGSQAKYLPKRFLSGEHDIDIKLRIDNISKNPPNTSLLILQWYMNDDLNGIKTKEHYLDIVLEDSEDPLRKPYFKIS